MKGHNEGGKMAGNVSSEGPLCGFARVTRVNTLIMCEKEPLGQAAHSSLGVFFSFQAFGKITQREEFADLPESSSAEKELGLLRELGFS